MLSPALQKKVQTIDDAFNRKMIFGIHGGGNIGLGLVADIVSKSLINYEIIATSNNQFMANLINSTNRYCLRHKIGENNFSSTVINNVKIISRNAENIIELYKKANIVAICLTATILERVAKDIAQGLIERYKVKKNTVPLKILILMNIPNGNEFVSKKIQSGLKELNQTQAVIDCILKYVTFIPTVVDRIVTKIEDTKIKAHLKKEFITHFQQCSDKVEDINLQVDTILANPKQLSESLKKFNLAIQLFDAEENYSLYVPNYFTEAQHFPDLRQINDLKQIEAVKNKYINGPHAIIAWMGAILGCKTIGEAIRIPAIRNFIKKMMDNEIAPALMAEFPDITHYELKFLKKTFIKRCLNSIDDPVTRVGRDPLRKLNSNERIRGSLKLCQKHDLNISTTGLEQGIAAAILYAVKELDNTNPECLKIRELYLKSNGNYETILCYKGSASYIFKGLDTKTDRVLINNVIRHIQTFERFYHALQLRRRLKHHACSTTMVLYRKVFSTMTLLTQFHSVSSKSLIQIIIGKRNCLDYVVKILLLQTFYGLFYYE